MLTQTSHNGHAVRAARPKLRRGVQALVAFGLIFALTGCLKVDITLTLSGDTASGTMIIAVDKDLISLSGQSEEEFINSINGDVLSDAPQGVRSERYDEGNFVGTRFILTNVSLDEFNKDSSGSDDLKIIHDKAAKQYKVTGVMDLSDSSTDAASRAISRNFDIRIAITFPGKVISHNGELSGNTVTWKPKAGEKTTIEAVAEEPSAVATVTSNKGLIFGAVGGGIVLLGLLLLLFLLLMMRRRKQVPATAVGYPGYPGYPGGPESYSGPPGTPAYPSSGAPAYPTSGAPDYPSSGPPDYPPTQQYPPYEQPPQPPRY